VTAADREEFVNGNPFLKGHKVKDIPFPEHKPLMMGMRVDGQGRVWVQTPAAGARTVWEVHEPSGRKLGEVRLTGRARLAALTATSAYVVQYDEDDVETLHRFRIAR
jgi:sugar lactone lactonase YvrE